ncbi:MAG: hypothetical protein ABSD71_09310 [Bacteroidales bacterium]|jgi:hypothetical protein
MFKKDALWFGMLIGILEPAVLFGLMYLIKLIIGHLALDKAMFVCVALNIVPIRYYFITANLGKTGRGVLAMTVILIILVTIAHI